MWIINFWSGEGRVEFWKGIVIEDPISQGIISGLIVEGIKEIVRIGRYVNSRGPEAIHEVESLQRELEGDTSLNSILSKSVQFLSRSDDEGGALRNFLASPEVEAIVRQIYAAKLSGRSSTTIEQIRQEFEQVLQLKLYTHDQEDNGAGGDLFDTLVEGCDRGLTIAIDNGVLAAHEARASLRHQMLQNELATVRRNLSLLTQGQKPDLRSIVAFEERYRSQVVTRYGTITPPYVDVARRLPIDDLYVPPNFVAPRSSKGEELEELKTPELLASIYRAVLLGNPGSGKSTFTHKLCFDLTTRYSERLLAGRQLTPILVVLRDYGAEKRTSNCSILQFIERKANSDHQLQPPPFAFEYLLLNGRAVVVFDGLDELLDTRYRQEVSRDVESFCSLYPSVPVLVTSREVGYEQAPLDERQFEMFRLTDFKDEQVEDYVTKWFTVNTDLTPEQQHSETRTFLNESRIVSDLRANPLMLGLMCNIYRGENYIPRNRPDVYRKCAEMLFERWDRSRGIHYSLPFEAHIRPSMTYLAFWIYSDEALQGGVTEEQLISKSVEYLHPNLFEDRDEAALAAREFIAFCRGRAWVFTDTGTTARGDRLYQFTHRTFLEYFTASYLTRQFYTPDALAAVLTPRISKREWDIVAQLAFQIQSEAAARAGDDLLCTLIEYAERSPDPERWNCLSFATRALGFMVPSASVRAKVALAAVDHCVNWTAKQIQQEPLLKYISMEEGSGPTEAFASLVQCGAENRSTVANRVESTLVAYAKGEDALGRVAALEIASALTMLHFPLSTLGQNSTNPETEVWSQVRSSILETCADELTELCPTYFNLCFTAYQQGLVSVRDLVTWHGIKAIFQERHFILTSSFQISLGVQLMDNYLHALSMEEGEADLKSEQVSHAIKEVGRIACETSQPWLTMDTEDLGMFIGFYFRHKDIDGVEEIQLVEPDALFGLFVLFATMMEVDLLRRRHDSYSDLLEDMGESNMSVLNLLRVMLTTRYEDTGVDEIEDNLVEYGLTASQLSMISRWIRQEISFVQ